MESFTKTKLTDNQLDLLVQTAFGLETSIISKSELTGGMFNAAYELELSDGRSVILKVAPSEEIETLSYEKNIMRTEVEALRLIGGIGSVPVPEVYSYDDSLRQIPCPYFFMEKVEGQPYNEIKESLSQVEQEYIETELGRYNRAINEVKGDHFGYFAQSSDMAGVPWGATFTSMMHELLADGLRLGVPLPASIAEIETEIIKYLPILNEVTEARLVHWDLWNGNVFVKNGRIISIIDWERALWGDVLLEYYFRHLENSPAFIKGYGVEFNSPNERLRKKMYDLYLDLILYIECFSRQYKNEDHLQWAHDNLIQGWDRFRGADGVEG